MNNLEFKVVSAVSANRPRDTSEIARLAGSPPEIVAFCLRRLQERDLVRYDLDLDRARGRWLRRDA